MFSLFLVQEVKKNAIAFCGANVNEFDDTYDGYEVDINKKVGLPLEVVILRLHLEV